MFIFIIIAQLKLSEIILFREFIFRGVRELYAENLIFLFFLVGTAVFLVFLFFYYKTSWHYVMVFKYMKVFKFYYIIDSYYCKFLLIKGEKKYIYVTLKEKSKNIYKNINIEYKYSFMNDNVFVYYLEMCFYTVYHAYIIKHLYFILLFLKFYYPQIYIENFSILGQIFSHLDSLSYFHSEGLIFNFQEELVLINKLFGKMDW